MDSESFANKLSAWLDEQIYLLGGQGLLEPDFKTSPNERELGALNDEEKKIITLVLLQEKRRLSLFEDIAELVVRRGHFIDQLFQNEEESIFDQQGRYTERYCEALYPFTANSWDSPYDKQLSALISEYSKLRRVQYHCGVMLDFLVSQRLSYFGDLNYVKGFKIMALPENRPADTIQVLDEILNGLYDDGLVEEVCPN